MGANLLDVGTVCDVVHVVFPLGNVFYPVAGCGILDVVAQMRRRLPAALDVRALEIDAWNFYPPSRSLSLCTKKS